MDNKKYIHLNKLNNFYLIVLLSYASLINSLVEIPFKRVPVKGIPKYPKLKIIGSIAYENQFIINDTLNKKIFLDEDSTFINSNEVFITTVKIGSKEQEFNLLLDTGSYNIWVAQNTVIKENIKNKFNPSLSETCKKTSDTFDNKYGTGSCSGNYYIDFFKYINDKKFKIQFGVANSVPEFELDNADGIIGLAHYYDDIESISFIHMLKEAQVTDSLKFSFKFDDIDSGSKGKMYIGKHKDFTKENIPYCSLYPEKEANIFWVCTIDSFGLKNKIYEISYGHSFPLIFDTGTNFLILPLIYFQNLQDYLENFKCTYSLQYELDSYFYQIVCSDSNKLPDFTLTINNYNLNLPKEYMYFSYKGILYSKILFGNTDFYIIGSPFFLAFHTLFDKEEEKLYFYPENRNFNKLSILSIIFISIVLIILFLGLGYIIARYLKIKKIRIGIRREEDLPQSNYANSLL